MTLTIGVDIGGTKIIGGVVDPDGGIQAHTRRPTPADDTAKIVVTIVDVVRELRATHDAVAVGVGAAGWIDASRSKILFAPHLAWRNEPLRDLLAAEIDLPVLIENDGNAAAWAEFTFGAAREVDDSMVLLTVGTGIGGGIIVGGQVVRGAHGVAAEMGHTLAVRNGRLCRCGRRGCLEQYASGSALVRLARQGAREDPVSATRLLDLAGGSSDAIDGPLVTRAARAGDQASLAAFDTVGKWLAGGLSDMVQVLDPQVLVVGGGVAEAGDLLMAPTRRYFEGGLAQRGRLPIAEVRPALMGNKAGLIGAADLARLSAVRR